MTKPKLSQSKKKSKPKSTWTKAMRKVRVEAMNAARILRDDLRFLKPKMKLNPTTNRAFKVLTQKWRRDQYWIVKFSPSIKLRGNLVHKIPTRTSSLFVRNLNSNTRDPEKLLTLLNGRLTSMKHIITQDIKAAPSSVCQRQPGKFPRYR